MKLLKYVLPVILIVMMGNVSVAESIGFIDMDKVLQGYTEAQKLREEAQEKQEEYEKLVLEKQKEIEKARKEKKSDDEIQDLVLRMQEELRPKQEAIIREQTGLQQGLLNQITRAASKTAKEYGIEVVLDKRVVYHGGFDLTDFLLEKMNK